MHKSLFAQEPSFSGRSGTRAHSQQNKTDPEGGGKPLRMNRVQRNNCALWKPTAQWLLVLLPISPSPARWPALALCGSRAKDSHTWGSAPGRGRRLLQGRAGPACCCVLLLKSCIHLLTGHFSLGPHSTGLGFSLQQFASSAGFRTPLPMPWAPPTSLAPGDGHAHRAPLALTRGHSGSGQAGATPRGTRSSRRR